MSLNTGQIERVAIWRGFTPSMSAAIAEALSTTPSQRNFAETERRHQLSHRTLGRSVKSIAPDIVFIENLIEESNDG
jgi:hypothetical protein